MYDEQPTGIVSSRTQGLLGSAMQATRQSTGLTLDTIPSKLAELQGRVAALVGRVAQVGDYLAGARPQAHGVGEAKMAPAVSALEDIHSRIDSLFDLLSRVEEEQYRVESACRS